MNCDNLQVWRVPPRSKIVIGASGDENLFNVIAIVDANGQREGIRRHHEIMSGKTREIQPNDKCLFTVHVTVTSDPPSGHPVTVKARVDLPDGSTPKNRDCSWEFLHAGQFTILIFVNAK
jgi:hypothetical protein